MKVKDLMADLARMDAEADVYVRITGLKQTLPPFENCLYHGYYRPAEIKQGARFQSDVSILLDER